MIVALNDGGWRYSVRCDECDSSNRVNAPNILDLKQLLRKGGWSFGPGETLKGVLCPAHADPGYDGVVAKVVEHMESPEGQAETQEAMRQAIHRGRQEKAYEYIDHPQHYGGADDPYECIKVIEAWELGFNLGSALRYISRAGKKPGEDVLRDLKKARWYIDREIERRSK